MRLYDGRSVNRFLDRRFKSVSPGRDAIVWDYDDANHTVRCKIQGTDEYIVCHYPRNFRTKEEWCKRGNAVRIEHKGGMRGYLEVVGHGRAIPSPVAGPVFPTAETPFDGIVSGGAVAPYGGMTLDVGATVYRIDGLLYTLNQAAAFLVMGDGSLGLMGSTGALPMGASLNRYVTLDAAPAAGEFRYDLIVAGIDGNLSIIKGTAAAESPAMPAVPADHVRIRHVFVIGGVTAIAAEHVNALWEERKLAALALAFAGGSGTIQDGNRLLWEPYNDYPTCSMTITFTDQYGWSLSGSRSTTLKKLLGSGNISGDNATWGTADIAKASTGATVVFHYRRDQTGIEVSPAFSFAVAGDGAFAVGRIVLLDVLGNEVVP